ncbi:hypothetical protein BCR34DRAFT_565277 [Clohesyomyces aquaticus]|uniref:SEP domain-containing protein n=1 Tax=Clohesyomyces aquaticus TaxID=1231657 RepID=A0A1Y1ZMH9_9PLEO|nr:hypothetical protein BCR34DRAFT_565277 [Clohesyomyces aquaticus]
MSRVVGIWKANASLQEYRNVIKDSSATPRPILDLWEDGFSVCDGPCNAYGENANIIQDIYSGRGPASLLGVQPGEQVELEIYPHKNENYKKPENRDDRIQGYYCTKDKLFANQFGLSELDTKTLVQVKRMDSPRGANYLSLLVEFTGIPEAAQAIDNLQNSQSNTLFEFVKDPCAGEPFGVKGPQSSQVKGKGAPPVLTKPTKPDRWIGKKPSRGVEKILVRYRDDPRY